MVGQGQGKNLLKRTRVGKGLGRLYLIRNEPHTPHNLERIGDMIENEVHMDDIGSGHGSPIGEDQINGDLSPRHASNIGTKRIYGSFSGRAEMIWKQKVHKVVDPTPLEQGNEHDRLVRTKHMHRNRQERNETAQNNLNSSQASATSAARKRGQRGKYRSLVIEKSTLGGKLKLDVEIPNYVLQAVGVNAWKLVNFCGYVVRMTAFMNGKDWSSVAASCGDAMWMQVKNKFKIKDSTNELPRLQAFMLYVMQPLYHFWKSRLHRYYKELGGTHEERLKYPPDDFPHEQWKHCCEIFNSDDFKKVSMRNSKNRLSDKWIKHTTGNLSFPETQKNDNVKPDADVIWLAQHTRKNDKGVLEWVSDNRSKKVHSELQQLVQYKDKEGAPRTQEEMLLKVLGPKSGHTRGKGSGYGGSARARQLEEQQQKIQDQQNKIDTLEKEMEEYKAQQEKEKEKYKLQQEKEEEELRAEQQRSMAEMEKRLMQLISARTI